jgi:energy-coupling factor transporter ATP-binding protein EcfA2
MVSTSGVSLPHADQQPAAATLPDQVNAWRDRMTTAGLLDPAEARALDVAISEARAGRVDNPPPPLLTILLLGATGGGKSALLNALAGAEIARSHHLRPTTSQPTIYMHESISPSRLFEYGPELGELARSGGAVQTHSRDDLRNKIIIDAPDIDSYRTEHRETVVRLLPVVDVVLYVVTPFSYKDDIGWEMVHHERGRRAFAFVMNKWDNEGMPRIAPGEPGPDADFARLVQQRGGYENARLFLTSARSHTGDPGAPDRPAPASGENFDELKQWLEQGLSTSRIEQIQRRRRRSLWGALAGALSAAVPAKFDADGIRREAVSETDRMIAEGKAAWAPLIEHRAEAMARRREEEGRPHSPGPFGRLSALFSAILNAGASFRKVAEPRPDVTLEEVNAAAARSTELTTRKLGRIEWHLRQEKIPAGKFPDQLAVLSTDLGERLSADFQARSEQIIGALIQPGRTKVGWVVLVVFELLAVALFGLAAWRLVLAFIAGTYLDLRFTLNLLALLVLMLAAGSAIMAMLFPPVKVRIRRELTAALAQTWQGTADRALVTTDAFLEELEKLRDDGQALLQQCNARVTEITRDMNSAADIEADRLFVS